MTNRTVLSCLVALLVTTGAAAQDDRAAGLFTQARHLPLVAQSATLEASGGEARLDLVQVFFNDGDELGQADYRLHLPEGAIVLGHGFWSGGRFLEAELEERTKAEAAHARAADEGRASTILKSEGPVHAFSVHPVPAGAPVRIELSLLLPLERALGRSVVRLPVDEFLGQGRASTTLVARIQEEHPLSGWAVEGAEALELEREGGRLVLALSTRRPVEIAWTTEGPALAISAAAVPIPEGGLAVGLSLLLDDASEWARPAGDLHLVVDGSWSMRRRAASVEGLLERLSRNGRTPTSVRLVAERVLELEPGELLEALEAGAAGHAATWQDLEAARQALHCHSPERRCVVVTDPQIPGLMTAGGSASPLLLLAEAEELAHLAGSLPEGARVHQEGVDSTATLGALADELSLPTLRILSLKQEGIELELPSRRSVAEGGMLRLFTRAEGWADLELQAEIDGTPLRRRIEPVLLAVDDEAALSLRLGYYRELLAELFATWRRDSGDELRSHIVELSLREGIPTAFTALQVDDPRLSMHSIKPGDPLLTVKDEPGLLDVVAWYPFGEMRRLAKDPDGDWHDRFLVPRDWPERSYRIDVFKRHADGRVESAHAWYRLDDTGPDAVLSHDEEHGLLVIDTGEGTPEISSVIVHAGEDELILSPSGSRWACALEEIGERAEVVVRDKAGNRSWFIVELKDGALDVRDRDANAVPELSPRMRRPALETPALRATGRAPLRREGRELLIDALGSTHRLPAAELPLHSLDLTAWAEREGELLLGTRAGDLLQLDCRTGRCEPRSGRLPARPITGVAPLPGGGWLVGALGSGLLEWRSGALHASPLSVGSRFVTSVLVHDGEIFVGTAYRGLWRLGRKGLVRTGFPHDHVAALESKAKGLEVVSGHGRFRRLARDRFARLGDLDQEAGTGSARLTSAATHRGLTWIASFDRGLMQLVDGELVAVPLGLDSLGRQVDDLEVFAGRLWLGTQGGLYSWSGREAEAPIRVLDAPVHDLFAGERHLFVASGRGLFEVRSGEDPGPRRLDDQAAPAHAFFSVTEWEGAVWAGGMEGLYRHDGDRLDQIGAGEGIGFGWVTALLPDESGLLIGTYSEGVHVMQGGAVAPVPGLEDTWVPPNGLHAAGGEVWIGSLGRAPHRWGDRGLRRVALPAADLHAVAEGPGGVLLLLTSEGLLSLEE